MSHNFMETEAYSLRFGEFKAVGKKFYNTVDLVHWLLTIAVVYAIPFFVCFSIVWKPIF